jgi:RimJ/RimL family protein N-acetyltransferase
MVQYYDILILKADAQGGEIVHPEVRIEELSAREPGMVLESYISVGHEIAEQRIIQRFKNGLRFFRLWQDDRLVGTTWIVCGTERYLDEFAWLLPVPSTDFWVRDVFISPEARGRKYFAHFMKLIVAHLGAGTCQSIWSDVDRSNEASVRAHLKAGFVVQNRVRSILFKNRVMLRSHAPAWSSDILEIRPNRRLIYMRFNDWKRHRELIA